MFLKKLFNFKYLLKYLLVLICCTFKFINIALANMNILTFSNWDLWYYYPFEKACDTYFFLTGDSNAMVQSINNNNIKLYFGISSSRDGNFNWLNNKEVLLYGNLYVSSDFNDNTNIVFGFKPGELDKSSITANRQYSYSLPGVAMFNNYSNLYNKRVVFDGSYMQYNNAFSFTYNKKLFLSNTHFGFTFTPNLDYNISKNTSFYNTLQKNLGSLDGYVNYYNEYNDVGYGLITAARIYTKLGALPKGVEFYVSPNIDYLGFGTALSFLGGYINGSKGNFIYDLSELYIYYSLLKLNLIATYGYNNIHGGNAYGNYYYSLFSFNINYLINSCLRFKSAIFFIKSNSYKINQGISFGFNIKI